MKLANILSTRNLYKQSFYDLVYEWEDILSENLNVPVLDPNSIYRRILINKFADKITYRFGLKFREWLNNYVEEINTSTNYNGYSLVFNMGVYSEPSFATTSKSIPAIIDFWKYTDLDKFYKNYRKCKIVLISSLEVFDYLKEHNCPLQIAHFPLSLSDKYKMNNNIIYKKKYDILLAGRLDVRTNQILRNYLTEFCAEFPDTEYLYQQEINEKFYYVSNKRGIIGEFNTRELYIKLLKESKISFYSTPGLDGGEKRTGGFNPVTPRYLELLSAQCLLLGRYPRNAETDFYELDKVCPNILSYEHFKKVLISYLEQNKSSFDVHQDILNKHYTSCRATLLKQIIKNC